MADGIFFAGIALFGLYVGLFVAWKAYADGRAERRWIPVDATIVACEVGSREGTVELNRVRQAATYFFPRVRYAYFYEGRRFECENLGGLEVSTTSRNVAARAAAKLALRYPPGTTVIAYANPTDPSDAVIVRGQPRWFIAAFIVLAIAWGAGFGLFAWRHLR
jgi:hypothetical protein